MATSRFMMAMIVVMTTIVSLYIFMATFGSVLDQMGVTFAAQLPGLALPTPWNSMAIKILTYWTYVWKAVVVICIAMGVWLIRILFVDVDYQRQY